jgi:hypothetical protein
MTTNANSNNTTKTLKHITLLLLHLKQLLDKLLLDKLLPDKLLLDKLLPDKLLLDKLLPNKLLLNKKLLVKEDKLLYILYSLRSLIKQKRKKKNSKYKRKNKLMHFQMLLKIYIIL